MKIFDPKLTGSIEILNTITGTVTIAGGLNVEGSLGGAVTASATASYVEFDNIANKPTLISSSIQIASDISGSTTSLSSSIASDRLKNTTDTLTGDLTVTGTITAQEFHTEFISASIIYQSGSTQFGNSSDDTHNFTGRIGIGTNDPQFDLHVVSTGNAEIELKGNPPELNLYDTASTVNQRRARITIDDGQMRLESLNDADTTVPYRFIAMDLTDGNIGFGTTTPDQFLHIEREVAGGGVELLVGNNGANQSGTYSQIGLGTGADTTGTAYLRLYRDGSGISEFKGYNTQTFIVNSAERMRIDSSGNLSLSTGDLFINSGTSYNDKGYIYLSNQRTAIISDIVNLTANGDTSLDFQTRSGGSTASSMFIDEFRRVGIGTTGPTSKLDVAGVATVQRLTAADGGVNIVNIGQNTTAGGYSVVRMLGASNRTSWEIGQNAQVLNALSFTPSTALGGSTFSSPSMVITNGGNAGFGTTSPLNTGVTIRTTGVAHSTTATEGTNMHGLTLNASTNESVMTGIWFTAGDGNHWSGIAGARSNHVSTWGTHLSFYTHPDATTNLNDTYERIRIQSDGSIRHSFNPGNGTYFWQDTTNGASMFYLIPAIYVGTAPYNSNRIVAANSSNISLETGGAARLWVDSSSFTASVTSASDAGSKTFMNNLNTDCGLIPVPSSGTLYLYARSGGVNQRVLLSLSSYFTGQHGNKPVDNNLKTNIHSYVGMIVSSVGTYYSVNPITKEITTGKDAITISEALPEIKLTDKDQDKSVWGVVTNVKNDNYNTDGSIELDNNTEWGDRLGDDVVRVNGLGEGAIWVTNINGNIENGDYICSSIIPGYGRKQDDDLLHNYTVAKSTMNCDFDLNNNGLYICEEFEFEDQTYRKAFIGCTYHCS